MFNRQSSSHYFVYPILLSIVTQVIIALQALFYIAFYCDLPWYTPALFLVSSNLLVYGLPLLLMAHILWRNQHGSDATHKAERAASGERYR